MCQTRGKMKMNIFSASELKFRGKNIAFVKHLPFFPLCVKQSGKTHSTRMSFSHMLSVILVRSIYVLQKYFFSPGKNLFQLVSHTQKKH